MLPENPSVFAHFSPESVFVRKKEWLGLLICCLKKQGLNRLIFSGAVPAFPRDIAENFSLEAFSDLHQRACHTRNPVLVTGDSFGFSLNLTQLFHHYSGATVLYTGKSGMVAEESSVRAFDWYGSPSKSGGSREGPEYQGAFVCSGEAFLAWKDNGAKEGSFPGEAGNCQALTLDSAASPRDQQATRRWLSERYAGCLFLDRDGIVNVDVSYPWLPEHLQLNHDIVPVIRWARSRNLRVVVLTNQSGIARGKFTSEDVEAFNRLINEELLKSGVGIDDFFVCPHHPEAEVAEFRKVCGCRKPFPGLALKAMKHYPTDLRKSFMVGDKLSDQLLLPGLTRVLVKGNYPLKGSSSKVLESLQLLPDFLEHCFVNLS